MLVTPMPDADEVRENAAFGALLGALARPGTWNDLPEPGAACLLRALCDRETRVFADDPAIAALLAGLGAAIVAPAEADHAMLSLSQEAGLAKLALLPVGSAVYPDHGATVVVPLCGSHGKRATTARSGDGRDSETVKLRLTGPGIDGSVDLHLPGVHPGVWDLRARLCRYPLGWELVFVEGRRIVAIPRSTFVEVL